MTAAERRTIAAEAAIGAVINGVLSALFVLLVFGGRTTVGVTDLRFDALPQTFMVALMSATVPTWLTRKRLAVGRLGPIAGVRLRLPRHPLLRGLTVAVGSTLLFGAVQWLILPALVGDGAAFARVFAGKVVYGALLGAIVSAAAVRIALGETRGERR